MALITDKKLLKVTRILTYFMYHFRPSQGKACALHHGKPVSNEAWKNISSYNEILTHGTGICWQIVCGHILTAECHWAIQFMIQHMDIPIQSPDIDEGTHIYKMTYLICLPICKCYYVISVNPKTINHNRKSYINYIRLEDEVTLRELLWIICLWKRMSSH